MSENIERMQSRLLNIESVEPILAGLRTISMGSWKIAQSRMGAVDEYAQLLQDILYALADHLPDAKKVQDILSKGNGKPRQKALLIVGTERGLCGGFNQTILNAAKRHLEGCTRVGETVETWVLGSRVVQEMQKESCRVFWSGTLSATALPPFDLVVELAHRWLNQYQSYQLDVVEVIYNKPVQGSSYKPVVVQLIPPAAIDLQPNGREETWPPPIIETDPLELLIQIIEQFILIRLYTFLLESTVSEHAARYELMEDATQNASELIDELNQELNTARRQEITSDMQLLAAGAGLLSRDKGR